MSEVLDRTMANKCSTCAFRPGTAASRSEVTLIKASLCIDTGEPFMCHESPLDAWCAGVADALAKRFEAGKLMSDRRWVRNVKAAMAEVIYRVENGHIQDDAEIRRIFREEIGKALKKEGGES